MIKNLRKIFLDNPTAYRDALITDHQIRIVKFVEKHGEIYSSDYGDHFKVHRDTGSSLLKRLCDKGYLKRYGVPMECGRMEFIYKIK